MTEEDPQGRSQPLPNLVDASALAASAPADAAPELLPVDAGE